MSTTQILQDEHRIIERVLDCLEKLAERCRADGRLEAGPARDAIEFLRGFADRNHHGKEEAHLFPMMEQRGFSPDAGPTAVMRREHEEGRLLVGGMADGLDSAAAGEAAGVEAFLEAANGFINLLRQHIHKENQILFPMAEQALTEADKEKLLEAFARVNNEEIGEVERQRLMQVAASLAERCGVEPAA
jgi:hemerythrin-like domain-containing protein